MSPTVLYAAPPHRRQRLGDDPFAAPYRVPHIDPINENDVRRVLREELDRLDGSRSRAERHLTALIDALNGVVASSSADEGARKIVMAHIEELRHELAELKERR